MTVITCSERDLIPILSLKRDRLGLNPTFISSDRFRHNPEALIPHIFSHNAPLRRIVTRLNQHIRPHLPLEVVLETIYGYDLPCFTSANQFLAPGDLALIEAIEAPPNSPASQALRAWLESSPSSEHAAATGHCSPCLIDMTFRYFEVQKPYTRHDHQALPRLETHPDPEQLTFWFKRYLGDVELMASALGIEVSLFRVYWRDHGRHICGVPHGVKAARASYQSKKKDERHQRWREDFKLYTRELQEAEEELARKRNEDLRTPGADRVGRVAPTFTGYALSRGLTQKGVSYRAQKAGLVSSKTAVSELMRTLDPNTIIDTYRQQKPVFGGRSTNWWFSCFFEKKVRKCEVRRLMHSAGLVLVKRGSRKVWLVPEDLTDYDLQRIVR